MANRPALLNTALPPGFYGRATANDYPPLVFQERTALVLHQVAAWPNTVESIERQLVNKGGYSAAPGFSGAILNSSGHRLVRVEPLKWWLIGQAPPVVQPDDGVTLDLSHARIQLDLHGPAAAELLNRFLPVDLRPSRCPAGQVYMTQLHHTSVLLLCDDARYSLLLPTSFAVSLAELLCDGARQFGYQVLPPSESELQTT